MDILILGGTGFIGAAILMRLAGDGHRVTGLGRDTRQAARRYPGAAFVRADLARMSSAADWTDLVAKHQIIVNCAGALQDGPRDDLAAVQERAMLALHEAAKAVGGRLIVQISARTDGGGAGTEFLATKRRSDAALKASGLEHVILRPALVVGRNAHGGTALVRALAGFPLAIPSVHADSPVDIVGLDDVTEAVVRAVDGRLEPGSDIDLAAPGALTLGEVLALHRGWLGLAPARVIAIPALLARPLTALADVAGRLGWRSPLRSTAMAVMEGGVQGGGAAPAPFALRPLQAILAENPSGVQDLWFARLYLLKAPVLVTLSAFWLVSGLVPLLSLETAAEHFRPILPPPAAYAATLATCALDIWLGLAVLWRRWTARALWAMLVVSLAYLASATLVEPGLWLDPLGPLVKVGPSMLLALVALATLDER
ncbi:MAG: SDR family oxidoreductase [Hoeflea sp.]|uniref:SDR family oxidoreductase n=1 Tax=Hoeflea sp. TaxID=1940281 RepID=UPI00273160F8|nr:SDR family oxidoreductase [Hoeflea sp.]MDP2121326.1 SDR family oxidoreductase [Hoeflea sp.]